MDTTTDYGTWVSVMGISAEINPGTYVYVALGDGAHDFDVDGLEAEFRSRIADALEDTGISLVGDEFIGPAYPTSDQAAAQDGIDLKQAIEDIDVYEFVRDYEWDTIVATAAAGAAARTQIRDHINDLVPAKYSEAELARRAGVDRMTVRNWLGKR